MSIRNASIASLLLMLSSASFVYACDCCPLSEVNVTYRSAGGGSATFTCPANKFSGRPDGKVMLILGANNATGRASSPGQFVVNQGTFENCVKYALLAQASPEKYQFDIVAPSDNFSSCGLLTH
jgi:hypothetical protein